MLKGTVTFSSTIVAVTSSVVLWSSSSSKFIPYDTFKTWLKWRNSWFVSEKYLKVWENSHKTVSVSAPNHAKIGFRWRRTTWQAYAQFRDTIRKIPAIIVNRIRIRARLKNEKLVESYFVQVQNEIFSQNINL